MRAFAMRRKVSHLVRAFAYGHAAFRPVRAFALRRKASHLVRAFAYRHAVFRPVRAAQFRLVRALKLRKAQSHPDRTQAAPLFGAHYLFTERARAEPAPHTRPR